MFDKAVYEKYQKDPDFLRSKKKRDKLFSTEVGSYRDISKHDITDENVIHAIDLR